MSTYHDLQRKKAEKEQRQRELALRQQAQEMHRFRDMCEKKQATVSAFLQSQLQSDVKDFLDSSGISKLNQDLTKIGNGLSQASSIEILRQLERDLTTVKKMIKAEIKSATKRRKEHLRHVAALEKELTSALNDQTSQFNTFRREQYGSYVETEALAWLEEINQLYRLLQNKQFEEVVDGLSKLTEDMAMVKETALFRCEQKEKATALLLEVKALSADPQIATWVGSGLASLERSIDTLLQDFVRGHYEPTTVSTLAILTEQRDALTLEATERQQDEKERKKAVQVFIEALEEAGFFVSPPHLLGDLRSAVLITATKPGRSRKQEVGVKVNLDGRIEMDVDGGDPGDVRKIQESRLDRQQESQVACRQVASRIMEFVAKKGVGLEEVRRHWHNPDKIAKGAKDLSKGSGQTTIGRR